MNPLLFAGMGVAAAALLFLEWRRTNRRHRLPRLAATLGAVAALLGLAVQEPREAGEADSRTAATLWTPGADPAAISAPETMLALPDARSPAPPGAVLLPDPGTLRRRYPQLRSLRILGAGLDPADLPALSDLHLAFDPGKPPAHSKPEPTHVFHPRTVPVGQAFSVDGRLAGLPPGGTFPLTLDAPDGSTIRTLTAPANAQGEAPFRLDAPALPAAGRFVWRLRAGAWEESVGVAVVPPTLPRVLVLESAPNFDTAALRRWYAESRGTLLARTQVGQGAFRYVVAQGEAPPFTNLNTALLADKDLVVTDPSALAALAPEERTALLTAIHDQGLGLLVRAEEETAANSHPPPDLAALFPWKLAPEPNVPANEERLARPHWLGQGTVSENTVPVSRLDVALLPSQNALVDDGQGRPLVAAVRHGRGFVALALVRDTARWQRANDPATFAAYWSFLFSRLSRPADVGPGRWDLVDGGGPVFVDHPLVLRWSGPAEQPPVAAVVSVGGTEGGNFPLALAQDPEQAGVWCGTVWPRDPGWHRVVSEPGGATLDFYVHPREAWPALQAERRRQATERFAAVSATAVFSKTTGTKKWVILPGWWWTLFLISAGYLWVERRLAAGR